MTSSMNPTWTKFNCNTNILGSNFHLCRMLHWCHPQAITICCVSTFIFLSQISSMLLALLVLSISSTWCWISRKNPSKGSRLWYAKQIIKWRRGHVYTLYTLCHIKRSPIRIFKIIDVFVKVGWPCVHMFGVGAGGGVCKAKQGFYLSNTEEELWCPAPRWTAECWVSSTIPIQIQKQAPQA